MKKREMAILEILTDHHRMDVLTLAEKLGVSQVTVRKDLQELEKQGVLTREHGYAVLGGSDDVSSRLAYHHENKRKIAELGASLVSGYETVMIESGSCCALLAEIISNEKKDSMIITNSAFIAGFVRKIESSHVVLLGGDYQKGSQVTVGPILRVCAGQFYVDKLFIGMDGWSAEAGFAGCDHLRAQAVRDMAERTDKVFILSESYKFDQHGLVALNLNKPIYAVVTDDKLKPEAESALLRKGIKVYKAACD